MEPAEMTAKIRARAAARARRQLLGPIAGAAPGRWIRSIQERLDDHEISSRVVQVWQRSPATVETYDFPDDFPLYFRRSKAFDERMAYRLRDVRVSVRSGLTWIPDGPLLQESYGCPIRTLGWAECSTSRCYQSASA